MRKNLIICLLLILVIMTYILITSGLKEGKFGIESFLKLQQKTAELHSTVYELQNKNTSEYEEKMQDLRNAASNYKTQKDEYEKLIPLIQGVGSNSEKKFDLYDIDFLWTIIGNYATEEGVVLQFDVSQISNDAVFSNIDYILCDLKFSVSGEYLSIKNFLYDIENDDRLSFEIRNFTLEKEGDALKSTFVVKSTPINKTNLSIGASQ